MRARRSLVVIASSVIPLMTVSPAMAAERAPLKPPEVSVVEGESLPITNSTAVLKDRGAHGGKVLEVEADDTVTVPVDLFAPQSLIVRQRSTTGGWRSTVVSIKVDGEQRFDGRVWNSKFETVKLGPVNFGHHQVEIKVTRLQHSNYRLDYVGIVGAPVPVVPPADPPPPVVPPVVPPVPPVVPPAPPGPAGITYIMYVTGYGTGDNDPAGSRTIAYPGSAPRHSQADGAGTYDDPVTVAVQTDGAGIGLVPGTRVYVPRFSKYGIIEDECATCHGKWIDIFDGSTQADSGNLRAVASCQEAHTGNFAVEVKPPAGRSVITAPLYSHDGTCAA